ncbi:hypothetical protein AAG906_017862 [Vitis piasezkii]
MKIIMIVASHLLSEKERNDLAQLINVMVSYSITYKNMKSDPLPGTRYMKLHQMALVVKQLLMHEVSN